MSLRAELLRITVDTACGACSAGWGTRGKPACCLKINTSLMPLPPPCPPRALFASSSVLPILPSSALFIAFLPSPLLSTLLCLPFHVPCPVSSSTVFLSIIIFSLPSLLPFPLLNSLSTWTWGPGLLPSGPCGSFSLNLTISYVN